MALEITLRHDAEEIIKNFIQHHFRVSGATNVVIGLSGGLDSTVVAKLCVDAIGNKNVIGIYLPDDLYNDKDANEIEAIAKFLNIKVITYDITTIVNQFFNELNVKSTVAKGNIKARTRMIYLYAIANEGNRLVIGTSNKSELLMGYFTKFGDGASDFGPIGDLYKTQVKLLAKRINIPEYIINKIPTAKLWENQTDEGELGLSYEILDRILLGIEMQYSIEKIAKILNTKQSLVQRIVVTVDKNVHKRKMPLIPKLGIRTLGLDWRE